MCISTRNFDSFFFSELGPFWTSKFDENERYYNVIVVVHIYLTFLFNFFSGSNAPFWTSNLTKLKDTTEQLVSTTPLKPLNTFRETDKMCRYAFYQECWFDLFEEQFISPFLSDCLSLMLGIAIHCKQNSQAILEQFWSVGYVSLLTFSFIKLCHFEFSILSLLTQIYLTFIA